MKFLFLLFSSVFMCLQTVNAQDNHGSHEAHVHGEAEMTLILLNDELAITFESPSANLVGFEHPPETDQQHNALEAALIDLREPISWLQFEGGDCDLVSATASSNLKTEHEGEGHSEFSAEYLYRCNQASNLDSILITLQSSYPGIEHIEVQWIINDKQGASELEADNQRILLQ